MSSSPSTFHLRWDLVRVFSVPLSSCLQESSSSCDDDTIEHAPLFDNSKVTMTTLQQLQAMADVDLSSNEGGHVVFLRLLSIDELVYCPRSSLYKHRLHLTVESLDPEKELESVNKIDHDVYAFNVFATNLYHRLTEMQVLNEPHRVGLVVHWPKGVKPIVRRPTLPFRREEQQRCMIYFGFEVLSNFFSPCPQSIKDGSVCTKPYPFIVRALQEEEGGGNPVLGVYVSPSQLPSTPMDIDTQLSVSVIPESQQNPTTTTSPTLPQSLGAETNQRDAASRDRIELQSKDQDEANGQDDGERSEDEVCNGNSFATKDSQAISSAPQTCTTTTTVTTASSSQGITSTSGNSSDFATKDDEREPRNKSFVRPVATVTPQKHPSLSKVGYKRLGECTTVGLKHKHFVWAVINKVAREPSPTRTGKYMASLYIRDEDYDGSFGHSDYQFSILCDNRDLFPPMKADDVIRIHYMVVQKWQEELTGRVFSGACVTVVPGGVGDPINPITKQNSATFQFTAEDEARVIELRLWWQQERERELRQLQELNGSMRDQRSSEVTISEIDSPGYYDIFCWVIRATQLSICITDGTTPNPRLRDENVRANEVIISLEFDSEEDSDNVSMAEIAEGKFAIAVKVLCVEKQQDDINGDTTRLKLVMRDLKTSHFIVITDRHSRAREIMRRIEDHNNDNGSQESSSVLVDSVMERVRLLHEGVNPNQVYQMHPEAGTNQKNNRNHKEGNCTEKPQGAQTMRDKEQSSDQTQDQEHKTEERQEQEQQQQQPLQQEQAQHRQEQDENEEEEHLTVVQSGPMTRQRRRAMRSSLDVHVPLTRPSEEDLANCGTKGKESEVHNAEDNSLDDSSVKVQSFTQLRMEVDLNESSSSSDNDADLQLQYTTPEEGSDDDDDDENLQTCPDTYPTK